METVDSIMQELQAMGSEQTRKTWIRHGAPADKVFGVKVGDMKTIVKRVKKNYELAKALYNTGNYDAMYLAGLIGDEKKMTKEDLSHWAQNSHWSMTSEYTVPFVAGESVYGWDLGLEWIKSSEENIASAGWATLSAYISITPDEKLDYKKISSLLKDIEKKIHKAPNRVRYTMNGFILCCGAYIADFYSIALDTSKRIGEVYVDMGGTACKVPNVIEYLKKMQAKNYIGKKKKTARC